MKNLLFLLALFLLGCPAEKPPVQPSPYAGLAFDASVTNGLSAQEREAYWRADEGIQYLPVDVLLSLDRPSDSTLGLYEERLLERPDRIGLYPDFQRRGAPPVGITSSTDPGYVQMAGLNCSTCHTALISYRGKAFFVDGGPGLFAVDRMIKDMILSIVATVANPVEFIKFNDRYQARAAARLGIAGASVGRGKDQDLEDMLDSPEHEALSKALKEKKDPLPHVKKAVEASRRRKPGRPSASRDSMRFGSGAFPTAGELSDGIGLYEYMVRRFAFFYAQTKYAESPESSLTAESGLGRANPWAVTKNLLAYNVEHTPQEKWSKVLGGPVSTPHLWGYDSQARVFWTGVTNSMLERNVAQGVALLTDFNWETYDTTVSAKKLEAVSAWARKIVPPKWPEHILGPVDRAKADSGKPLFQKHCLGCHAPYDASFGPGAGVLKYLDVGTDDEYYKGQKALLNGKELFSGVLAPFLSKVKSGIFKREGLTDPSDLQSGRFPAVWKGPDGNKFVAKPLWGIWATAPYLHNGSVPNIRELLKKPAERTKAFWVGSVEYDPSALGFVDVPVFFSFRLETSCPKGCVGNGNGGHDFGTGLSGSEKDALIEFLKAYKPDTKFE